MKEVDGHGKSGDSGSSGNQSNSGVSVSSGAAAPLSPSRGSDLPKKKSKSCKTTDVKCGMLKDVE